MQTGLVVETGEAREVHHFCVLAGYRRRGDQPLSRLRDAGGAEPPRRGAGRGRGGAAQLHQGGRQGLLKVMSKMGISTYQSYCGAQIFDAIGLSAGFVDKYFTGTATHDRGRRPGRDRRGDARAATATPMAAADRSACSTSAATTPSGSAARPMPGPPRRSPTSSMRCAATSRTSTAPSPRRSTSSSRAPADHARPDAAEAGRRAGAAGRGRAGRGDRQALRHRRDELRLDQPRGAHHAGAWR